MSPAHPLLLRLAARWRWQCRLEMVLFGLGLGLPVVALGRALGLGVLAALGLGALLPLVAFLLRPAAYRGGADVLVQIARHLDRTLPALEESSELLLPRARPLSVLERLQQQRLQTLLDGAVHDGSVANGPLPRHLLPRHLLPRHRLGLAAGVLVTSVLLAAGLWLGLPAPTARAGPLHSPPLPPFSPPEEVEAPGVAAIDVLVEPPAYTGLAPSHARGLDLRVPAGSRLTWAVTSQGEVDEALLTFDDGPPLTLEAPDGAGQRRAQRVVTAPRLYHLALRRAGEVVYRSAYARIEIEPDQPPALEVVRPDRFTEVAPEGPNRITLEVEAEDDYGLGRAVIVATVARGGGEMVAFREERLAFARIDRRSPRAWRLVHVFDLAALGLEPGSELYFHVEARDRRTPEPNQARSATYRVRMVGEGALSVPLGRGIAVRPPPTYFRSQRQIIIDSERLIAEQASITRDAFERRSQNLGLDQAALRLRYGTILGEEFEDGQPVDEEHDHDHGHEEGVGLEDGAAEEAAAAGQEEDDDQNELSRLAALLPEGLVHLHDSTESATFFTTDVKATLKEALAAMWDAELQLRLYEPAAALPHAYRALRALKKVQQASRVYVQRVGFEMPPLDLDRRLSGDLSKVRSRRAERQVDAALAHPEARRALAALRSLRTGGGRVVDGAPAERLAGDLEAAEAVLVEQARGETDIDLGALDQLRALAAVARAGQPLPRSGLEPVEQALWRLLATPMPRPSRPAGSSGSLFAAYRAQLTETP